MSSKGFIFDLDGVLVDTARYHFIAWQKIADNLGIAFTPEQNERLKGVSRIRSLEIILELGNIKASPSDKERWLRQKNEDYLAYINNMDEREILPGVYPVLHYLRIKNQALALGSASKNARPILEKVKLLHFFDVIVDGNDVTNAKPDPEVFLHAARQLGKETGQCLVFEDSLAGIQAANTAGMTSIGIGSKKNLNEAQYVFPDFTHIDTSFLQTHINK
jgi:beta-phosphoglucomutase